MQLFRNIQPEYVDQRGGITMVLDTGEAKHKSIAEALAKALNDQGVLIRSVLLITSKKGTIRANHYHKTDFHYCYLLSGKMEYTEAPMKGEHPPAFGEPRETAAVNTGDMVYTPPMSAHAMRFLDDTVFLAFARNSRLQENYEADTVRVKLIE